MLALVTLAWGLASVAGCVAPAPRVVPRPRGPVAPDPAVAFAGLVEAHNRERESAGRPPLAVSDRLNAAAQAHADDMARRRRMTHRGRDGSSPFRRMGQQGYRFETAGENVAYGQRTLDALMGDWMGSPGHRRNILGNYTEIGVAYATDGSGTPYWCVTFGRPLGE
jgi:uncharacterized protein YkwD